jgi:hypothetical protein
MKGVHPILSHSALLIIGLVAMGMVIASLSSTFSNTERNLVRAEVDYIAESAKDKILEIHSLVEESDYSNGTFQLNLPEEIGNKKYLLSVSQKSLSIRMPFENDNIEVNKTLNIDASLNGETYLPAFIFVEKVGGMITMELV